MSEESELSLTSVDGLTMAATITRPDDDPVEIAVLVHGGGGVDRHEWQGLYDRFAAHLAQSGIASLRFDHRCYLSSQDPSIDLTISGVANDIDVAIAAARRELGDLPTHLVGGSFGGGAGVLWANHNRGAIESLVLLYPLLDFRRRLLGSKRWWQEGSMTAESAERLRNGDPLRHVPRMQMSRALINEAALFDAEAMLNAVDVPTLIVHGSEDAIIDHGISQRLADSTDTELISIDGADHGFSAPGDVRHETAASRDHQSQAFDIVSEWVLRTG